MIKYDKICYINWALTELVRFKYGMYNYMSEELTHHELVRFKSGLWIRVHFMRILILIQQFF